MTPPEDFAALRAVSARFGADPLLVQGPGGNTSVKAADVMWIKASGTVLADAEARDIFVAVDLPSLSAAVERDDPLADQPAHFALARDGLRPSIETCLHAVFPHRVVLHVHCVNTIAIALAEDARERLAAKLGGFRWAYVDYAKPGARLAAQVRAARAADTDVVVLGNHGLIVGGDTVEAAAKLVEEVAAALRATPGPAIAPDQGRLTELAPKGYAPAPLGHSLHDVALSPRRLALATGGSLYPDHVVFCGPGATVVDAPGTAGVPPAFSEETSAVQGGALPFLLAPGAGALLRDDASAGALAMARCLGDVLARVAEDAIPRYLTADEVRELTDWDAEKYRQALNAR
jgi:rhamnose utilization protein RhaD (predicted bifunctional aldolase and dehydrogenase)